MTPFDHLKARMNSAVYRLNAALGIYDDPIEVRVVERSWQRREKVVAVLNVRQAELLAEALEKSEAKR